MKKVFSTLTLALLMSVAIGFISAPAEAWWYHHGYHHRVYCKWVSGYWKHGHWHHYPHKVCWRYR